jgi:D-alanyl-D-alanine dipeptidase
VLLQAAAATAPGLAEDARASSAAELHCTGTELVSLLDVSPRPLFELRYASPYNFLSRTLYSQLMPRLCCPVALALQQVQQDLASEGLGLKVWDAIQDPRYVSNPAVNAGRHTRGTAVDVTLVNRRGTPLAMPTDYDDFSEAAHVDATGTPSTAARNARRLRVAMERRGFVTFPTEWWHFDWKGWKSLSVVGTPENGDETEKE